MLNKHKVERVSQLNITRRVVRPHLIDEESRGYSSYAKRMNDIRGKAESENVDK